jgi:hypothetical protein
MGLPEPISSGNRPSPANVVRLSDRVSSPTAFSRPTWRCRWPTRCSRRWCRQRVVRARSRPVVGVAGRATIHVGADRTAIARAGIAVAGAGAAAAGRADTGAGPDTPPVVPTPVPVVPPMPAAAPAPAEPAVPDPAALPAACAYANPLRAKPAAKAALIRREYFIITPLRNSGMSSLPTKGSVGCS